MASPRSGDTTVRVDRATSAALARLAKETGAPRRELIALAVERLRRQRVLESANAGFAAMKKDRDALRDELEERRRWESASSDGLSED